MGTCNFFAEGGWRAEECTSCSPCNCRSSNLLLVTAVKSGVTLLENTNRQGPSDVVLLEHVFAGEMQPRGLSLITFSLKIHKKYQFLTQSVHFLVF